MSWMNPLGRTAIILLILPCSSIGAVALDLQVPNQWQSTGQTFPSSTTLNPSTPALSNTASDEVPFQNNSITLQAATYNYPNGINGPPSVTSPTLLPPPGVYPYSSYGPNQNPSPSQIQNQGIMLNGKFY